MAKNPSNSRLAAIEDDEELDGFYRPELPVSLRASARAPQTPARQAPSSSKRGLVDPPARQRAGRSAYPNDPYDDPDLAPDPLLDEDERISPRPRRRAPVRKNGWLSSRWGKIALALCVLAAVGALTAVFLTVRNFFLTDPRFRIDTASSIQLVGNSEINRAQLLSVFGSDVGHNIFKVPLAQRRAALQALPWVEHATVMRLLPNQLRVAVVERVPVAFVRTGNTIELVDATGVLLTMPPSMLAARHYSFPVVTGINAGDPAETRAERMQLYERFVRDLNGPAPTDVKSAQPNSSSNSPIDVSQQLSEVDVSDTEDVRARMPSAGADILVHFGDEDFANRYKTYRQHLAQWRQQYPHLAAIDLRYDRQTVLEMDKSASSNPADIIAAPALVPVVRKTVLRKPAAKAAPRKPAPAKQPVKPSTSRKTSVVKSSAYIEPFDVKGRH